MFPVLVLVAHILKRVFELGTLVPCHWKWHDTMLPRMDTRASGWTSALLAWRHCASSPCLLPTQVWDVGEQERDLFHSETLSAKQIFNTTGPCSGLEDVAESVLDRMRSSSRRKELPQILKCYPSLCSLSSVSTMPRPALKKNLCNGLNKALLFLFFFSPKWMSF